MHVELKKLAAKWKVQKAKLDNLDNAIATELETLLSDNKPDDLNDFLFENGYDGIQRFWLLRRQREINETTSKP